MRDMQASAIVTLEGWERYQAGAGIIRASPQYDARRIRVPFLMLERAADEVAPAYARVPVVVDSLRSARLRRTAFRDAAHGDFLSLPLGRSDPEVFQASARMAELFLSGVLLDDDDAAAALDALTPASAGTAFVTNHREGVTAGPTEEELYRLAETDPDRAARVYRDTRTEGPPPFRRHVLTRAAQFAATDAQRAIILGIVADAYPESVDARFRLGEALIRDGRTGDGVAALRTALGLISDDPALDPEQRESWRERIEARLAEIR
jgi:hypothetical protein